MKKGISDFCKEASQATGWDDGKGGYYWNQDHKTIERRYNNNTDSQVVLILSSLNDNLDNSFKKIDQDDCNSTMYRIVDECPRGQNIPGVDWAHGGQVTDTNGLSWTIITDNSKYHPGICSFFVMENVWNGPEDQTKHHWTTRTSISDAENNTVTGMADGWDDLFVDPYESEKTDLRKNTVPGLYAEVEIEGYLDGNKIELGFQVGNYGFNAYTDYAGEAPRCEVGDWVYNPPRETNPDDFHGYRNHTCWVYC
jgi:hypothetical protein